jgi:fibronectin type III domain protein
MKRQILFPLVAMLIATPLWAASNSSSSVRLSTTALSFNGSTGNVSSQPVTLTVIGPQPVTITSFSVSNSTFSLPHVSLPVTIPSGRSVTGQVSARPSGTAQTGTLTIGSTAGTFTVALSETAANAAPASHSVSLTWKAPASGSDAVDSYQVDRAVSGSTQYSPVGTTTAASTAFTDTSVQAGRTYVYEVRSVDQSGNTSNPSNVVTLAVP